MNQSLKEFRQRYRDLLLNFLWRQWSALGVAGQATGDDPWVIDLEALLLFTCTIARNDPRLFDEVLDWLELSGRFVNVSRLKRIQKKESFVGGPVLGAIAGFLSKGADAPKWRQLAEENTGPPEHLFFSEDGSFLPIIGEPEPKFAAHRFRRGPLRLRGYSQQFRPIERTNLALQLRGLFGVNARCEIVAYLLTHEAAHPSQIARDAYYFERAVQNTLVEMSQSGIVQLRAVGRHKHYWLKTDQWITLLNRDDNGMPRWITWPPLFSALERIWLKLNDPKLLELNEPLLESSVVRHTMVQVRPSIERAGFDKALSDDRQYLGEKYLPVFLGDITRLLG